MNNRNNRRKKKPRTAELVALTVGIVLAAALTVVIIKLTYSPVPEKVSSARPNVSIDDSLKNDESTVSSATQAPSETTQPQIETEDEGDRLNAEVKIDGFSDEYNKFLSSTVFVGDSICSGISVYGFLPESSVLATENVSAHTINSYTFDVNGTQYDYAEALKQLNPKTVIFFMGMNDTYTSEDAYCNNYADILRTAHAAVPNAKLYVSSITPIASTSTYTTNARIDSFNEAIQIRVASAGFGYVDISSALKGSDNCLLAEYSGYDGIHLPSDAYRVILNGICEKLVK